MDLVRPRRALGAAARGLAASCRCTTCTCSRRRTTCSSRRTAAASSCSTTSSPLQQLAAARRARRAVLPGARRDAVGGLAVDRDRRRRTRCPANQFAGPNAPSGAVLTFYQRAKAAERPWFEIVDANGKVVRTLRGGCRSIRPIRRRTSARSTTSATMRDSTASPGTATRTARALARHVVPERRARDRSRRRCRDATPRGCTSTATTYEQQFRSATIR